MQRHRLLVRGADIVGHRHIGRRRAGQARAAALRLRLRAACAAAAGQGGRRGRFDDTRQFHKAVAAVAVTATGASAASRRGIEQLVQAAIARGNGIGDRIHLRTAGSQRSAMRVGRIGGEHTVVDSQCFFLMNNIRLALAVTDLDLRTGRRNDHIAFMNRIADLELDHLALGRANIGVAFEMDDFTDDVLRVCHDL